MRSIIIAMRNGFTSIEQLRESTVLSEEDFHEAMQQAIQLGYVTGISYQSAIGGQYYLSTTEPKITYEGLAYVERINGTIGY